MRADATGRADKCQIPNQSVAAEVTSRHSAAAAARYLGCYDHFLRPPRLGFVAGDTVALTLAGATAGGAGRTTRYIRSRPSEGNASVTQVQPLVATTSLASGIHSCPPKSLQYSTR